MPYYYVGAYCCCRCWYGIRLCGSTRKCSTKRQWFLKMLNSIEQRLYLPKVRSAERWNKVEVARDLLDHFYRQHGFASNFIKIAKKDTICQRKDLAEKWKISQQSDGKAVWFIDFYQSVINRSTIGENCQFLARWWKVKLPFFLVRRDKFANDVSKLTYNIHICSCLIIWWRIYHFSARSLPSGKSLFFCHL